MPEITFTQYLLPDGRKTTVRIDRPAPIALMAAAIEKRGYRFECEMLSTREISLTIADDDGDAAIEIVPNGPEVPKAVDRMIEQFAATLS